MSLNLGVMSAAVTLDDKNYRNTLASLESTSQTSFKKIAAYAAGFLSLRAVGQFGQAAIRTFSDLEEETNKFNVVFAGLGKETSKILEQMREDFGLSELSAKRMLAGTGDMLTGFGFDNKVALALSEGAAKLGADIASFSNYAGGAAGATTALTKAMLGEAESAKLLGVVIRQDSDEYKNLVKQAMTTGVEIKALGQTFKVSSEQQAKAVAALAIAYQQSPNAIGDFVRSKESLANQTRILQNNFEQLTATIGGDLAPAYTEAISIANKLLKSYNDLSPATRELINSTIALSAAMALLGKTGALAKANMLATGGLTALKAGWAGVAAAAKGAAAAIGPVGGVLIAAGAAAAACNVIYSAYNRNLEKEISFHHERVEAAKKLSTAHQQEASANNEAMRRLQELAKYDHLSNVEKAESEKLIKQITDAHKGLDIALDKTTGKLKIGASAWEEMNKQQKTVAILDTHKEIEALEKETRSLMQGLKTEVDFGWFKKALAAPLTAVSENAAYSEMAERVEAAKQLKTLEEQIAEFQEIANELTQKGDEAQAQKAKTVVVQLQKQFELKKQLEAMNNGKAVKDAKAEAEALKKSAEESKKIRKAIAALQEKEFSIKFNAAEVDEKLSLLKSKMNDIFNKEVSGKYKNIDEFINADRTNMTKDELKAVEKLVELRGEQARIEKELADDIERERDAYTQFVQTQFKNAASRAFDKRVSTMTKEGDKEGAINLVQSELDKSREAARKLRKQYTAALELVERDNSKDTDIEKRRRAELKRQMEIAMSDEIRLTGKLDNLKTSENQTRQAVGAWTLEALSAQFGAPSKPEQQTAKNTKKTVEILEKVSEQLNNGSMAYNE